MSEENQQTSIGVFHSLHLFSENQVVNIATLQNYEGKGEERVDLPLKSKGCRDISHLTFRIFLQVLSMLQQ